MEENRTEINCNIDGTPQLNFSHKDRSVYLYYYHILKCLNNFSKQYLFRYGYVCISKGTHHSSQHYFYINNKYLYVLHFDFGHHATEFLNL